MARNRKRYQAVKPGGIVCYSRTIPSDMGPVWIVDYRARRVAFRPLYPLTFEKWHCGNFERSLALVGKWLQAN